MTRKKEKKGEKRKKNVKSLKNPRRKKDPKASKNITLITTGVYLHPSVNYGCLKIQFHHINYEPYPASFAQTVQQI
jgi:hypothetical protein